MNQIPLIAGTSPIVALVVVTDADGAAVAADSTPTCTLLTSVGGAVTGANLGLSVTSLATGIYACTVAVDTLLANGYHSARLWGYVTAIVSGVSRVTPINQFEFMPTRNGGLVVADGSNSATSFKVSANTASDGLLSTQTDDAAKALMTFVSGNLAGQIRKVTAWDSATGFITVDSAFTSAPSAGDGFLLVNY